MNFREIKNSQNLLEKGETIRAVRRSKIDESVQLLSEAI